MCNKETLRREGKIEENKEKHGIHDGHDEKSNIHISGVPKTEENGQEQHLKNYWLGNFLKPVKTSIHRIQKLLNSNQCLDK